MSENSDPDLAAIASEVVAEIIQQQKKNIAETTGLVLARRKETITQEQWDKIIILAMKGFISLSRMEQK